MSSRADLERRLIGLAAHRFGKDATQLRPEDDFFRTLDVNSFQAMDLLTEIEDAFAVDVPDYELQGVTTFAGLAEVIRRRL